MCVAALVYIALHYGAPNTIDIDGTEEYALTDKVIHPYNSYFCQGLLAKSINTPNNFQSNATLYLLTSQPPLTDLEIFNTSRRASLNSDSTNYQSWNFYMNNGSVVSLDACYRDSSNFDIAFYLIKGSSNHNKWTKNPGSSHAVKYSRLSSQCQKISYRVQNSDLYFFVFYLKPKYHSVALVDIEFNFNRTVYHISLGSVVQNCSFPLDGKSSCFISVPMSSSYTALLSLNTTRPVDYNDGANVQISCQPRAWLYAVIILSTMLVVIAIVLSVVAGVCYKIKRGKKQSYSPLEGESGNATVLQDHSTVDSVRPDGTDGVDDVSIALKPSSGSPGSDNPPPYNLGYSPTSGGQGYGTNSAPPLPPYAT